jgi:hypothetical protein
MLNDDEEEEREHDESFTVNKEDTELFKATTTDRGKPKIIYGGFGYIKDVVKNGIVYWKCDKCHQSQLSCGGRARSEGFEVKPFFASKVTDHCHDPDWDQYNVAEYVDTAMALAKSSRQGPRDIISEGSDEA